MVRVPLRPVALELDATEYPTTPLADPDPPAATVRKLESLTAVHLPLQPLGVAVTFTMPSAPPALNDWLVGEIE
jgi:hypothetical protein